MRRFNTQGGAVPRGLMSGLLATGGDIGAFRAAAPLPVDAQRLIDNTVVGVGRQRLTLVNDLLAAGLTFPLANWLSVPTMYWEMTGSVGHATRTMYPKARGERQLPEREGTAIPIFCTWDDFSLDVRTLLASERVGAPLDTSLVGEATRNVNEAIEDQGWNGAGLKVAGLDAPGVLEAPTITYEYTGNEAWDVAGHTGEEILADVMAMIDAAMDERFYGPFNFYMPPAYWSKLGQDYKSATSGTILERLNALNTGGQNLVNFKMADMLPANTTALIQMTSDVIDVIVGQTPTNVSWQDGPGWETFSVILACLVVRVKGNILGQNGIVVGTPS